MPFLIINFSMLFFFFFIFVVVLTLLYIIIPDLQNLPVTTTNQQHILQIHLFNFMEKFTMLIVSVSLRSIRKLSRNVHIKQ